MKKLFNFLLVLPLALLLSCENKKDISLSQRESGNMYEFKASYPKSESEDVQRYMDKKLKGRGSFSFKNARIDGDIALDDKMVFYIKMYPGSLKIRFDKSQNSDESYYLIKEMGEGMKDVLTDN